MFTDELVGKHPLHKGMRPRWMLLDVAERVLPGMDDKLSRTADQVLRQRGVDLRMGTSVKEATPTGVLLSDGEFVDTRTLVWCVGVRPDPLAESLGLPMERGRLLVEPTLRVPGRPEVFACGDAAAVPDLTKPGEYTPMTAQHAWRQGKVAGRNVAASLGMGEPKPYRHSDLGFMVDLGGVKAAADPLGIPLSGPVAGAVTRGYHLAAMPGNRVRVAADWLLDAVLPRQGVQLGLVRSWSVPLDTASPELARMPGAPERAGAARERTAPERPESAGVPGGPVPGGPAVARKQETPDKPGPAAVPGAREKPHATPVPGASDHPVPAREQHTSAKPGPAAIPGTPENPQPPPPSHTPASDTPASEVHDDPPKPAQGSEGDS
jgi:NADH:ubiquinone reductase (H+-translocating)